MRRTHNAWATAAPSNCSKASKPENSQNSRRAPCTSWPRRARNKPQNKPHSTKAKQVRKTPLSRLSSTAAPAKPKTLTT